MPELAVPPSNTREGVVSIFCPSYGALPLGTDVNVAVSQFETFKKNFTTMGAEDGIEPPTFAL